MIKIGALWQQKSKDGETYFQGKFGDAKMLIFKNKFKKEDKQPDYIIQIAEYEKKDANAETKTTEELGF